MEEASELYKSTSPYWWLNSGGLLYIGKGMGQSVHGPLPEENKWRKLYGKNNPEDTEEGYYPQNLLRLITRGKWYNFDEKILFRVDAYNLSESINRNESNGVLLFGRYEDEDNLYYAGVRVDGYAVIKKKIGGTYHTLAQAKILPGEYDRITLPNLIPLGRWIGLRMKVVTMMESQVYIELYTDLEGVGEWNLVLSALDDGSVGRVVDSKSAAGVRSDFMDAAFSSYEIEEL